MCVCVGVCAVADQSDHFKTVKATDFKFHVHVSRDSLDMTVPRSRDPLNFWALNANSSKMVKTTDL